MKGFFVHTLFIKFDQCDRLGGRDLSLKKR